MKFKKLLNLAMATAKRRKREKYDEKLAVHKPLAELQQAKCPAYR